MSLDIEALRSSFQLVVERSPNVTHRFYEILFDRYPAARPLFSHNPSSAQEKMLTDALVAVIEHLEDAPWLESQLRALGAKHVGYAVSDDMYPWVGECLVAALAEAAGAAWSPRIERAWLDAFSAISGLMIAGARSARPQSPTLSP